MKRETPIGTWIRTQRGDDTLVACSAKIGVSRRALEAWEGGESVPTAKYLVALAALYKADLESLVKLAAESARAA